MWLGTALMGLMMSFGTPALADCGKDGCPYKGAKGNCAACDKAGGDCGKDGCPYRGKKDCASCRGGDCSGGCPFKASPEQLQKKLDKMRTELGLNNSQVKTIKAAWDEGRAKRAALKDKPKSPEKFKAMRQARWDAQDKVYGALTCEQREKLRKMKRERRAKKKMRHKRHHKKR